MLLLGNHAAFCIIRISSRSKDAAMIAKTHGRYCASDPVRTDEIQPPPRRGVAEFSLRYTSCEFPCTVGLGRYRRYLAVQEWSGG